MLKLYRMHKAVRIVNQRTRRIYNDASLYETNRERIPTTKECIEAYKPFLVRDSRKRERIARRAFVSVVDAGLIDAKPARPIDAPEKLMVNAGKGEDFIEMWFWGLFREILVRNNAPVSTITSTAAVVISAISLYISIHFAQFRQ